MSQIRTAIIGYGVAGSVFHAPLVHSDPSYALRAIVTNDPGRAADAAARYGRDILVPDVDALFERRSELDLVVVASPNHTHAPLARRAFDAGLDVVVDKPFALTVSESRELLEQASSAGCRLTVFQNRRWDGDFQTVAEAVRAGRRGEIHQFESAFEWWSPHRARSWRDTTPIGRGGGILFDLAPHLVDQALLLFGPVERVHAELDFRRSGAVNDDDSLLTLTHANGVRSRLWMSVVDPAPRPRFRVVGSSAALVIHGLDPQERQLSAGLLPSSPGYGMREDDALITGPGIQSHIPIQRGDYPAFYREFASGRTPVDPAESIAALELIEQAVRQAVV